MCRSRAEGGARCAAHTRPAYLRVMANATTMPAADLRARLDANIDAVVDYASTPSGQAAVLADVQTLYETYTGAQMGTEANATLDPDQEMNLAALLAAIRRGEARRNADTETRRTLRQQRDTAPQPDEGLRDAVKAREVSHEVARTVIDRVRTSGGLTVNPTTGREPTSGYCINEVGDCPKIPESEFFDYDTGRAALHNFLTEYDQWFTGPGSKHIGLWHDKDNGVVVLDRVDVIEGLDEALALGRARSQRSMWDVAAGREITLGHDA